MQQPLEEEDNLDIVEEGDEHESFDYVKSAQAFGGLEAIVARHECTLFLCLWVWYTKIQWPIWKSTVM